MRKCWEGGLAVGLGILTMAGGLWAADGDLAGLRALAPANVAAVTWQYDEDQGPSRWGELAPTTAFCEKGAHQSPIDIRTVPHPHIHDGLLIHYNAAPAHVVTARHTLEVDFQDGGTLEILGRSYSLKEFHFHEPSEHRLDGRTYPMEAHLVHRDATDTS